MTTRRDATHDKTLEDSFPASDPPASTGITGARARPPGRQERANSEREADARPKGTPTDERHATETAHHREDEERPPG
jgi:hypothetical protein